MKPFQHLLFVSVALLGLFLLTGCGDPSSGQNNQRQNGVGSSADGTQDAFGNGIEPEIVRDTAFGVIEKRQQGGQLTPSGEVSAFDGQPRMTRTPLESMIIVQGNMTGQQSAYLLPAEDYRIVQVGHQLQESTLRRWESTSPDHIPPPPPPPESPLRSRTGGTAENLVY
jgi:hypothetical protein